MKLLYLFIFLVGCQTKLVPVSAISPVFEDGTIVIETWIANGYFYREGHDDNEECQLSRTPVEESGGVMYMRLNGATETCSGITCEHCAFKKAGGCECKNVFQGVCTHTISKNRNLMRLR